MRLVAFSWPKVITYAEVTPFVFGVLRFSEGPGPRLMSPRVSFLLRHDSESLLGTVQRRGTDSLTVGRSVDFLGWVRPGCKQLPKEHRRLLERTLLVRTGRFEQ
jgi:hypothetical protein